MQKDNEQKLSQGINSPVGLLQGDFLNCEKRDATLRFAMVNRRVNQQRIHPPFQ